MMDNTSNFPFFPYQNNTQVDEYTEFSEIVNGMVFSSFASSEDASLVSSDSYFQDMFPTDLFDHDNIMINQDHDILEKISRTDIDEICDWIYFGHKEGTSSSAEISVSTDEWSPSPSLESSQSIQQQLKTRAAALDIPRKDIKLGNELSLIHLLKAYGEAMGDGNKGSLAKMIVQSINEKSNPMGNLFEQVAYHMFKSEDGDHGEYLRQESINNIAPALNLLYQTLICGRFAHNAANAAILESVPDDVAALHIVDFDIGEGIQWPALIEALSRKQKTVRLTAIVGSSPSCWEFEETKKRLLDYGKECGLRLYIEEKCIEDFAEEMRRRRKNGRGGRDWLVFNCMAALPHMGRRRRRRTRTVEFLKVAEELLGDFDGILTFGDGEGGEETRNCSSFESYFDKLLEHYKAVLEALECSLPKGDFAEARMAMESLFLAPMMRPNAWLEEWKEMEGGGRFESVLEGRRVSCESVGEAKVMVGEREDWYNVRMLRENEMVLRWKETVLVKVSTFCSRRWRR